MNPHTPNTGFGDLKLLLLLLLLFVGSGCAALIYEVVWFQMLELIIGSSAISIGVLLATFMGGMCAGSLGLAHFVPAKHHPLRIYALLEVGIGALGLLIFFGLPHVGGLYAAIGGKGMAGLLFRGLLSAFCLFPPTLLMGATLPAMARCVETTPKGLSRLGFFYAANTAGALSGSLLAGFYLLPVHDAQFATFTAVAINATMALAALALAMQMRRTAPAREQGRDEGTASSESRAVLMAIAFSGMTALGAEVLWTRLLSLLLGATVYTFSLILAAFLMGLGMGSGAGSLFTRFSSGARTALGFCQLMLLAGIAWAGYSITRVMPYLPVNTGPPGSLTTKFLIDLAKCLWAVLPAACLWGASFPLALAGAVSPGQDPGRLVGKVYAANTMGAIIGALGTSLFFIGGLGTQGAQRALLAASAAAALLILAPAVPGEESRRGSRLRRTAYSVVTIGLAGWLIANAAGVPGILVAYGRNAAKFVDAKAEFLYVGEGMNSSLGVSRHSNGVLFYHNAGKVQASSEPHDMGLQRMLGHLTTLVAEHPRSVLVIGCGAGVTAGAVSIDPAVEQVTIVEIERLVPQAASAFFGQHNFDVIRNPKVRVEIDDARHYIVTTRDKFDAITSDPFDPWVKGAATLYTREFFELLKQRLNPGGVVTVFVQLYQSNTDAVKSEFATFFEAFPNGTLWFNTEEGFGYDLVMLGQVEPTRIDLDSIERRLSRPEYAPVVLSLGEINFFSAEDFFSTFGGLGVDLKPWLKDAQINRDRNLRLQYLAGLGLDLYKQDAIYHEILRFRRFPEGLFSGSPERLQALQAYMKAGR